MPLTPSLTLFLPSARALRPPEPRPLVWSLPSPSEWTGEDVEFPNLIGCWWCHSVGRRGPQRRGPPFSDGDWTPPSRPGLGLGRGGARAFGHLGQWCWGGGGHRGVDGTHSFLARRVPSAQGRVEGRSRRPPPAPSSREGGGGACRVLGAEPVGRGAGGGW